MMVAHLIVCAVLSSVIAVVFGDVIVHDIMEYPRRRRGE